MITLHHITPQQYKTMPWKNLQGTTIEMVIEPSTASLLELNFEWRISSALVQMGKESSFSILPNYDRHLLLLEPENACMILHQQNQQTELRPLQQIACFAGTIPTTCTTTMVNDTTSSDKILVRDYNVMYKQGSSNKFVTRLLKQQEETLHLLEPHTIHVLYNAGKNSVSITMNEQHVLLQPHELLWFDTQQHSHTTLVLCTPNLKQTMQLVYSYTTNPV